MPVNIPDTLPAKALLEAENVFVMGESRAMTQDIRPLKILILNLMPLKIVTESQLLRVLSNTPLQVEVELLMTSTHAPRNTPQEHLVAFYKTFNEIKHLYFDGLIITGAPVELIDFEKVTYWPELCEIMDWSKKHVTSTFHICWGAQAGLYHHYGIKKYELGKKMFGVFNHQVLTPKEPLLRGFDDHYQAPHSRYTEVRQTEIDAHPGLITLSTSPEAGVYIVASEDRKQIFVTGHPEYEESTLGEEYWRDINKGMEIAVPENYYPQNDAEKKPLVTWRSHAHLIYSNWLNYYVYQSTPYSLGEL
ncbi:homoserine O-acetyltransferase MetA [Alkalitalea saponilacus]|uniref:Homoserine O-acetyltransferase n=1 Tax=Alkalitalea saponilacus TaxID=889453 RepID=A0A1T5FQP9_9BACT|nr:homoserine O-succinyltransferase [Alkalitalea saponilacus]ASB49465.1 homoserine O-succinyltransferase [Alkalitalea saponilacus]SKB98442.1 homoserine O-succinyltransferase [Alkalitalea saponilacus]